MVVPDESPMSRCSLPDNTVKSRHCVIPQTEAEMTIQTNDPLSPSADELPRAAETQTQTHSNKFFHDLLNGQSHESQLQDTHFKLKEIDELVHSMHQKLLKPPTSKPLSQHKIATSNLNNDAENYMKLCQKRERASHRQQAKEEQR